ncbi:MAG: DUF4837 family protein [Candidatus Marinimicrobia bacterium]|nr:DUF4837 family protein [Candidatus Neomarinimicrobiota bacterium]MCF7880222.1 DUF4837 family protein [Candidatus Neomarinimicrobiota bacterium]
MRKFIPVLILVIAVIVSCGVKRDAIGEPDELIVIADSVDWTLIEDQIRNAFAPEVYTPQDEPWYNIRRVSPKNASNFFNYKNILLVSLLRDGSPSLDLIQSLFSDNLVQAMRSGNQPVALKRNQWREQQLLMILTVPDAPQFSEVLANRDEELRSYFDEMFVQRQMKYLYDRHEQKKLSRRFQGEYDWKFRVPRDYIVIHERPDSNFVWIGRHLPIRWISVYWEDVDSPVAVDSSVALRLRRTVGQEHYGNISIDTAYVRTEAAEIDGQHAIRINGIWSHNDDPKGGAFVGFAYYDEFTNRLFYLDGQIFAPGMKKLVFLRRMEIILSTFTTGEKK